MSQPSGNPRPSLGVSGGANPHDAAAAGGEAHANSQKIKSDSHVQTSKSAGKKRRHRGGRRRRQRRPSFAAPLALESQHEEECHGQPPAHQSPNRPAEGGGSTATSPMDSRQAPGRNLGQLGRNLSESSLDSQELLDHRRQPTIKTRRESRLGQSFRPEPPQRPELPQQQSSGGHRDARPFASRLTKALHPFTKSEDEDSDQADDRTPLIQPDSFNQSPFPRYGAESGRGNTARYSSRDHSPLSSSHRSGRGGYNIDAGLSVKRDYDVNNPPSMPGSPAGEPEMGYNDDVITGFGTGRPDSRGSREGPSPGGEAIIDMHENDRPSQGSPPSPPELARRRTVTLPVEEDVCFPTGGLSDLAEEEYAPQPRADEVVGERRRRRRREWPDLSVLEDWSREEKEERSGGIRAKKISEPVLIDGRLRTRDSGWKQQEEDAPYRFTYFNEEFHSTIHSQTISELVQPGQTFRNLFIPDPPELESSDDDDEDEEDERSARKDYSAIYTSEHENNTQQRSNGNVSNGPSGKTSPKSSPPEMLKAKRYGPRPTFWLDVLCPTDTEMRVIAKAFGIHALTVEDIMMQEAREKVELFRHYYFINYCTFEQDINSPDYMQPVNMYVIVFREGLLSFHFSMTPHPANVRRRVRQLRDYLILSSDWISYAIIDDITDVFGPLIHSIEDEVDHIDDTILRLQSDPKFVAKSRKEDDTGTISLDTAPSGSDMLRRVGECRKKVMGLYRLLGNKADVIKGFAKRCNEQWEVAPKSEIGLYLGDIQDHILTMTGNLTHYETLLSRAHSNYLAQINIRMNERQEQTADVLGKLTVLGTIVLPMNIICGMWGMNVKVPGQEVDNLYWFWSITAGLVTFAVICFYVAKRVYGIV